MKDKKKMDVLVLDVETTISNKGNPFDHSNSLCYIGTLRDTMGVYDVCHELISIGLHTEIASIFRTGNTLWIGFNIKFDLHWLRKFGIELAGVTVWDCQLAHFILRHQRAVMPSLDEVAKYYGLGQKVDKIKEYWEAGIDTPDIPKQEMIEYLEQDLNLTHQIYLRQVEEFSKLPRLANLFRLQCQDLLVLEEMEWNGFIYNKKKSLEQAAIERERI